MNRLTFILLLLLLFSVSTWAEVVTLRSGQTIKGELLLQNDEVVIIRAKNGMRYQYPTQEVVSIRDDNAPHQPTTTDNQHATNVRPVNIALQAHGGAVYLPQLGWGGQFGADVMIGSRAIKGTRMFVGGGIGYRAKAIGGTTYSFIPLQAYLSAPLTDQKHAPLLGMNIGYGFSANKHTQGGICVGATFGGSYLINQQASLQYGIYAEWQQAQTDVTEYIDDTPYTNHVGCNFIAIGAKMVILF